MEIMGLVVAKRVKFRYTLNDSVVTLEDSDECEAEDASYIGYHRRHVP
ncbi:hypothetical protein PAT3040_06829 [Paenibacillus agaridevorans]|uniref:Uncharacterized protein n=1 Tax=Paenibacillus agaridevorans TaxID=171404 RepID=A0A2R5EZ72_9BACL|nr:hypothetical protein PAT3040_06829 [Paenibacillus agaridevorans]